MSDDESDDFIEMLESFIGRSDSLLIGFDLQKDRSVIECAYDDRAAPATGGWLRHCLPVGRLAHDLLNHRHEHLAVS